MQVRCGHPHCKIHIQKLERVERKFVRHVAFQLHIPIMNLSYEHIHISLCISGLLVWGESKPKGFPLSMVYSLINHGINSSQLLEIVTFSINTRMTRNPRLFFTPSHKYSYLKYSGMNRILETGNNHRDVDVFGTSRVKIKLKLRSILWVSLWLLE